MEIINLIEEWTLGVAKIAGILVIILPILGYRKFGNRERSWSTGKGLQTLRWPFIVIAAILYVAVGVLLWKPIPLNLSVTLRYLALGIGSMFYFLGIGLYIWGYLSLGTMFAVSSSYAASLYAGHRLVQSGPYRFVRHPMYLGVIFAAVGAFIIFRTWAMAIYMPTSLFITLRAKREEHLLAQEFGEEWDTYVRKVPGWFPRIKLASE
jgi:protein-S-isoprenylcysteine O-methyltransferase Ste14